MRILIGRTFFYEKQEKTFIRGKSYSVSNELGEWIVQKRLGEIVPGIGKLKEMKSPPKDKMMRGVKTK